MRRMRSQVWEGGIEVDGREVMARIPTFIYYSYITTSLSGLDSYHTLRDRCFVMRMMQPAQSSLVSVGFAEPYSGNASVSRLMQRHWTSPKTNIRDLLQCNIRHWKS